MKTLLITSLLVLVALTTVPAVRAEVNPVSVVTNAVEQAKRAVAQAQSALASIQSLTGVVISTNQTVVSTNATQVATTNGVKATINEAVIDILHGVTTASSDIYQASKTAITKAVDFTMTETPIVVKEFLHWKMAEAIVYAVAWSVPAFVLLFVARAFNKRSQSVEVPASSRDKTDQNDYSVLKWVFRSLAALAFMYILVNQGMVITKIALAPRVYLIEYVVSTVHNGVPPSQ